MSGHDVTIRAFGAHRVRELTGLSFRQLQYWDERGFVRPTLSSGRRRARRLYAFRDVVALRVAAQLRRQGVSLQLIRKVHDHLRQLDYEKPLAELRFWLHEGQLYFSEADTVRAGRRPEQVLAGYVVPVPAIVTELEEMIHRLAEASRSWPARAFRRPRSVAWLRMGCRRRRFWQSIRTSSPMTSRPLWPRRLPDEEQAEQARVPG